MIVLRGSMYRAIQVSSYLKGLGLVHDKDYDWYLDTENDTIIFTFNSTIDEDKYKTLILLKFS
jgi:hypothetical protein